MKGADYFCSAVASVLIVVTPAAAQAAPARMLNLEAGRLADALTRVSLLFDEQILYSSALVRGKQVRALRGRFTIDQALDRLLRGTGLRYRRNDANVLVLTRAAETRDEQPGAASAAHAAPRAASPAPTQTQDAQDSGQPEQIQEIVVTARRVEESAQEVPTAISVLGSGEIESRGVASAGDLNGLTPNLTLRPISGTNFITTIRGVQGGGLTNQTLDAGVSIYVDGVYVGRGFQAVSNLADLQRVEVLRGPQGTLFGRNVTGGAISFVTRDPEAGISGTAELGVGNYDYWRGRVTLNLGEWKGFSARATYVHSERRGWVENDAAGTVTTLLPSGQTTATGGSTDFSADPVRFVARDSLGSDNSDTVTAALRFTGVPGLTATYKFDYNKSVFTQPLYQIVGFSTFAPYFPVPGYITVEPNSRLSDTPGRMKRAAADFADNSWIETFGHNLTLEYELAPGLTIKNIAAYRSADQYSVSDLDGSDIRVNATPANPDGFPYFLSAQIANRTQDQVSDELQLIGTASRFDWIAGLFYFRERTFEQPMAFAYATLPTDRDYTTTTADYGATSSYARGSARSLAAYAHGTYKVTDSLDLAAGIRYSSDRKKTTLLGNCFFPDPALGDPVAARSNVDIRYTYCVPHAANPANPDTIPGSAPGLRSSSATRDYHSVDWDVSLTYSFNPDVHVYARAASGFQSGGFINFYDFLPEKMTSYELGLKSEFLNHRLRVNGDVFFAHRKNAQQSNYYGPTVGSHIDNITYDVRGAELEVTAIPVHGLMLSGSAGYTDADTDNGSRQPFSKWNVALMGQYDLPRFADGSHVILRADANWTDKVPSNLVIPTYPGTTSVFGNSVDEAATVPAQWTVNGRISLVDIPLATGLTGNLSVWAKNLLDDDSINFSSNFVTVVIATYKLPRTFGLDFALKF